MNTGGWTENWHEELSGPDYLRGISREPDYPDHQDFSDAWIDPDLESVGRFVRSCSMLEIALFQALNSLDPTVSFAEAEWKHGPRGCIRKLRLIGANLTPRARGKLEELLDKAKDYLVLRNGVVHGRSGRQAMSNVYVSHRWVPGEKGQPPRRERVEYDRNQLLLASVRAGNVASDILTGLEDWQRQMGELRRKRRKALGPGHPMRIEDRGEEDDVTHALASDGSGRALCGVDVSSMAGLLVPDSVTGAPTHELMFEDSNRRYHCTTCRTAADL